MTEMISKSTAPDMAPAATKLRTGAAYVTQSRFFSPVFNAAIFDGPIRIYFAQNQEALALKVYFETQERYSDLRRQTRGLQAVREGGHLARLHNVFVMLYPTTELFDAAFGSIAEDRTSNICRISSEPLGEDFVIGVRGPMIEETMGLLLKEMDAILRAPEA